MLRVGLTGGIGSGKSTVSTRLAQRGAVIIDADRIAREVVEPGTAALAAIADRFGTELLRPDGALDRPAMARVVFGDPAALRALEGITHPAIWVRTAELMAAAEDSGAPVVVHDMPLLVEKHMGADYHLVVVVGASAQTRADRLVTHRGMPMDDAWARIRNQADDAQRRATADVWLDNEGTPEELIAQVDRLWDGRLVPFAHNAAHGIRTRLLIATISPPDPTWPAQAARLAGRIQAGLGDRAQAIEHVGSTAVADLVAKDVIDLQVGVGALADADDPAFVAAMRAAGYVLDPDNTGDTVHGPGDWAKRFYGGCDPGRVVHVHVRAVGSAGWRWALDFRDRLRTDPVLRADYAAEKRRLAAGHVSSADFAQAKEAWFARYATQVDWATGR